MKAFLSHSSKDKSFVREVARLLGEAQIELDEKTFEYTFNVQAIRQALSRSSIFVYFLSQNSIDSSFVQEEARAALEARGKGVIKRVVVFALDGTSYRSLPNWMSEINIVQKLSSPKACARKIQAYLLQIDAEESLSSDLYLGREDDETLLRKALSAPAKSTPLFVHVAGHYGIGRRTFIWKTLSKIFPRRYSAYAEITLQNFEGIEEFYRRLYDIHIYSSIEQKIEDFEKFSSSSYDDQLNVVYNMIHEFVDNDDLLFVVDDGGVYNDDGSYQTFLKDLLENFEPMATPPVAFVHSRMMPFRLRASYPRSFHHYLPPLSEEATKELLSFMLKEVGIDFSEEQISEIMQHLDGHPFNIKFAAAYAANYGLDSLIADPSDLMEWRARRGDDFLKKVAFTNIEADILALLHEYRYIAPEMIGEAISLSPGETFAALRHLQEFCCIERREGYFHIAAPIREAVRRDKRFERTDKWKQEIGRTICDAISDYKTDDFVSVSILDSTALASIRSSTAIPFLSTFVLPSHLLRIARDYYDAGKRGLCIEFCRRAWEMKDRLPADARVETLRLLGLSAARTNDQKEFDAALERLEAINSTAARRVGLFLEGFKLRINKNYDEAEEKFLGAWRIARQNISINRELANLLAKQRRYNDAEPYARTALAVAPTNPYSIDTMAEVLLGKLHQGLDVNQGELDQVMNDLKIYGDAPGSSFFLIRESQRHFHHRRYEEALKLVRRALDRTPKLPNAHFLLADIHLAQRNVPAAEDDLKEIDKLLDDAGGFSEGDEARAHELEARIFIEKGQYRSAKDHIDKSAFLTYPMKQRMYGQLAKAVEFHQGRTDEALRKWALEFRNGGSKTRPRQR